MLYLKRVAKNVKLYIGRGFRDTLSRRAAPVLVFVGRVASFRTRLSFCVRPSIAGSTALPYVGKEPVRAD